MSYRPTEEDLERYRSSLALLKLAAESGRNGKKPSTDEVQILMAGLIGEDHVDEEVVRIIGTLIGAAGSMLLILDDGELLDASIMKAAMISAQDLGDIGDIE